MNKSITISKERLAEIAAQLRAKKEASKLYFCPICNDLKHKINGVCETCSSSLIGTENKDSTTTVTLQKVDSSDLTHGIDRYGNLIEYNKEQQQFISLASQGNSCILIGAAGTGKTTCVQGVIRALIQNGRAGILNAGNHKYLQNYGTPGVVCVSYTRRAVMNLKKAMSDDMRGNCITIHKLLEYEPVFYDVTDPQSGESKTTMRFEPTRSEYNPLPDSIHTIIIDESSMVSVELFELIEKACPHKPQYIFTGDIQQLPPIFGSAILGFKMLELPTIELTQVYRQALESPIIRLAHRILSGTPIPEKEYKDWNFPGELKLHAWKKKLHPDTACATFCAFVTQALDLGDYDPDSDMILCPFNKAFGTDEINKKIAQHIASKEKRVVYEIIAGFNKLYFSIGDKVLYDKEDAVISKIERNPTYFGKQPQKESIHLDYWGFNHETTRTKPEEEHDEDFLLSQLSHAEVSEDRVKQASHWVTVRLVDTEQTVILKTAGDLNALLMGYALTVHKSQGSEWEKVFLVLHQSHATMNQRELLYTAVTRAKKSLYVICEPETFTNGIISQRIKGNTLAEKAEFFKGKLNNEVNGK